MTSATHAEHRKRLRARFLAAPESFEDHELLELLLFYSIPRINTNEIAHDLISRFGSLKGVVDASLSSLQTVKGVGENSALYLRAIAELLFRYERASCDVEAPLSSAASLGKYLRSLFVGTESEISYILLFDTAKRLLLCEKLSTGHSTGTVIYARTVIELALANNAAGVVLAHNHPGGKPIPSGEDIAATNRLRSLLEAVDIQFIDHFIVAGNQCRPIINYKSSALFNAGEELNDGE